MQNLEWYLADLKSTGKNTIETVEKSLTDMFIRLVRIYPCLLWENTDYADSWWILVYVAFFAIMVISWQKEARTMPYSHRITLGVFTVYMAIDSRFYFTQSNSLEHCICTTSEQPGIRTQYLWVSSQPGLKTHRAGYGIRNYHLNWTKEHHFKSCW